MVQPRRTRPHEDANPSGRQADFMSTDDIVRHLKKPNSKAWRPWLWFSGAGVALVVIGLGGWQIWSHEKTPLTEEQGLSDTLTRKPLAPGAIVEEKLPQTSAVATSQVLSNEPSHLTPIDVYMAQSATLYVDNQAKGVGHHVHLELAPGVHTFAVHFSSRHFTRSIRISHKHLAIHCNSHRGCL